MGLDPATVIVLDALRKQRNLSDYEGDPITPGAVAECLKQAETLLSLYRMGWQRICQNCNDALACTEEKFQPHFYIKQGPAENIVLILPPMARFE